MSSSSVAPPTATSAPPAPSPTATGSGGSGGDGSGTSKPLLFFVALGFGVVFTNLWIIVGVKYCFRPNHRARMINSETGEPIDMNNLPRHRRRREKKLMSMDEVNERFPLTKYKLWRSSRESQGLPTAGGVTAPASRVPSLHTSSRPASIIGDKPVARSSIEAADEANRSKSGSQALAADTISPGPAARSGEAEAEPSGASTTQANEAEKQAAHAPERVEDEDEDDPISAAVPAELLQAPGDACAICIDSLDDDDEVRGLTCGHAFHASCIDPWLTGRRACCPLCKADYYTPKPRPEGEQAAEDDATSRSHRRFHDGRSGNVSESRHLWVPGRRGTMAFRFAGNTWRSGNQGASDGRHWHGSPAARSQPSGADVSSGTSRGFLGRLPTIPAPRMPAFLRRSQPSATADPAPATPAQLEAGTAR